MKKFFIIILVAGLLVAGYWFISPFFINKQVKESLPVLNSNSEEKVSEVTEIKKGIFTGFDKVHTGSGTVRVISIDGKNYIRFEDDFMVANGPDLYVGLGEDGKYIKGSELGTLKGNIGSQNYELPDGIDISNIKEVWIWCKAFAVPFSKAVLN